MFLKKGMQNQNVRGLQEELNDLGFDAGPADGIFGPRTERAVMAFQTDRGRIEPSLFWMDDSRGQGLCSS